MLESFLKDQKKKQTKVVIKQVLVKILAKSLEKNADMLKTMWMECWFVDKGFKNEESVYVGQNQFLKASCDLVRYLREKRC